MDLNNPLINTILLFTSNNEPIDEAEAQRYRKRARVSSEYAIDIGDGWRSYSAATLPGHSALGTIAKRKRRRGIAWISALMIDRRGGYVRVNHGKVAALANEDIYRALARFPSDLSRDRFLREMKYASDIGGPYEDCNYWCGRQCGLTWNYCRTFYCSLRMHCRFLAAETCWNSNHMSFGRGYREAVMQTSLSDALKNGRRNRREDSLQAADCPAHKAIEDILGY